MLDQQKMMVWFVSAVELGGLRKAVLQTVMVKAGHRVWNLPLGPVPLAAICRLQLLPVVTLVSL